MLKPGKIKRFMPFIVGIIAYTVVTSILNLIDKNTLVIRYMASIIVVVVYTIATEQYEKSKS